LANNGKEGDDEIKLGERVIAYEMRGYHRERGRSQRSRIKEGINKKTIRKVVSYRVSLS